MSSGRYVDIAASCQYGYQLNDQTGINFETTIDGKGFPLSTSWTHPNGGVEQYGIAEDFKTLIPTLPGQCSFEIN